MSSILLKMENISKRFPGVNALREVSLELFESEVLGLLGENGAGKSTLMKILSGIYQKDSGTICVNGKEVHITDVRKAREYSISIIHQEILLIPHMTIAENVFLGREMRTSIGFVDRPRMIRETQALLDRFGLALSATRQAYGLTVAQQQMVEIIRAVSFNARIVVMDEPTSSLSDNEVNILFELIGRLKREGVSVIYISHRLVELFRITDRITVLRDGQFIATKITSETNPEELVALMVGRNLSAFFPKTQSHPGDVILDVRNLASPKRFHDISFTLRRGEILGFSGLVGAGRSEVMKTIFGLLPRSAGEVRFEGRPIEIRTPKDAIDLGIGFVPENRRDEGLIINNTVGFNLTLSVLRQFLHHFHLDKKREQSIIYGSVGQLKIVTPSVLQRVYNLSGGNQQKIVVAKWLASSPKILIMDEPTRGIDVGAKAEIYQIMNDLASAGVAIIMVSSELPEIINMSDRVMVMYSGTITGELPKEALTQERVMHYATGGK